jgi:hypothetical protein
MVVLLAGPTNLSFIAAVAFEFFDHEVEQTCREHLESLEVPGSEFRGRLAPVGAVFQLSASKLLVEHANFVAAFRRHYKAISWTWVV